MHVIRTYSTLIYQMSRPRTLLMILLFYTIGDAIGNTTNTYDPLFILGFLPIVLSYINAACLNDLSDEEIDKINLKHDPERPLANGKKTSRTAIFILAIISGVAALSTSYFLGATGILFVISSLILNIVYSFPPLQLSHRGMLAPLTLPYFYIFIPFFMGFMIHNIPVTREVLTLAVALYIGFIGRIILKDYRDVTGDKQFGKMTFLIRHGSVATCIVAAACWVIFDVLVSYYFVSKPMYIVYLQPYIAVTLYLLYLLSRTPNLKMQLNHISMIGRFGNMLALLILTYITLSHLPYTEGINSVIITIVMGIYLYIIYQTYSLLYYSGNGKP